MENYFIPDIDELTHQHSGLGCKVTIASRNLEKLEVAAAELSKIGEIQTLRCNIREEEDVR